MSDAPTTLDSLNTVAARTVETWPAFDATALDAAARELGGKPEEAIQRVVATVLRGLWKVGAVPWFTATCHEGLRSRAAYYEVQGVMPGSPDFIIGLPRGGVLWLELKAGKGRVREAQATCRRRLMEAGHRHRITWTAGEAVAEVAAAWVVQTRGG